MSTNTLSKNSSRLHRKGRVREKISGTKTRPRLCIFRSLNDIYAQIIDDESGKTLVQVDSRSITDKKKQKKAEKSFSVGEQIAKKCQEIGISEAVFDRGGYRYHGRVRALAEGARKGGLKI